MSEVFSNKGENYRGGRQYPANSRDILQDFYDFLLSERLRVSDSSSRVNLTEARRTGKPLQKLWQGTELSAHDFADEVSRFFSLKRVTLAELMSAGSLADIFSQRFLRESLMFPYSAEGDTPHLAVSDPSDAAAIRAAEIVLGAPPQIRIASFEDIATVLASRLEDKAAAPSSSDPLQGRADDDVESLRDLASGAPVVRAVNDLLERAVELRASDIHIEPFRDRAHRAHARRRPAAPGRRRQPTHCRRR